MMIGFAEGVAALWACTYLIGSRPWALPRAFGTELCGGQQRWRNAWGVPNQLVILPLFYVTNGADCFHYVFMQYLVLDFVFLHPMDTMLTAHHIVCIVGHVIVSTLLPDGFSTYFAGVVALEVGGGFANLFDLGTARWRAVVYAVGMSVSNALAIFIAWQWACLPISTLPRGLCLLLTAGLIHGRQKACWEAVYGSRDEQQQQKSE